MKNKLIIGLGISGKAAARYLLQKKLAVSATDKNRALLQNDPEVQELIGMGLRIILENEITSLDQFDQVIISPGISPMHPILVKARGMGIEVIGEIELGCRDLKNKVVGITGTNGKTTVTLWIEHILNASGHKAKAVGNVGTALTAQLAHITPDEILVLELSSYQLETLQQPILDAALLLNITPDHLDRYGTMEAYASAKWRIGRCLKQNGHLFVEESTARDYPPSDPISFSPYGYSHHSFLYTDLVSLFINQVKTVTLPAQFRGCKTHELENLMAVYIVCKQLGVSDEQFLHALPSLKKPPHRIEWVAEINGVKFYDDSKGTNIDAVIRAIESLPGPIILIAGGVDKGAPYTSWHTKFQGKVKSICTIGQAADKIHAQLSSHFPIHMCKNMQDAVSIAVSQAKAGDTVLLSPGCASYDMFRDYAHRGQVFQDLVRKLC